MHMKGSPRTNGAVHFDGQAARLADPIIQGEGGVLW